MTAGARNKFYAYCSIGQQTQDLKYEGEPTYLEIGDENTFREFVTVNRSTTAEGKTRIGNRGNYLAYSHIGHDCVVGDAVVFSNNGTLAGHVWVGDHAVMGGLTAVHQFCRLGRFAITGGCSKIVQDVPPFMIADGNPAKVRGINIIGLERNGFTAESIRTIKEAFRLIYRSKFNTRQAVEAIQQELAASDEIRKSSSSSRRASAALFVRPKPERYGFRGFGGDGAGLVARSSISIFFKSAEAGASGEIRSTIRTRSRARFALVCFASAFPSCRTVRRMSSRFV
jgi:UDP-N-acetylglucosamine acyltransferase